MKRLFTIVLAACLAGSAGCHMFSKKKKKAPDPTAENSKTLGADTEKQFMQRWIDKRAAELTSQGNSPDNARAMAVAEYRKNFPYTSNASQAK
ncbi:MAG TPA: hypothetical protein VGG37_08170 [Opitutaceae bacterium]|jgi:hypothetical protein